ERSEKRICRIGVGINVFCAPLACLEQKEKYIECRETHITHTQQPQLCLAHVVHALLPTSTVHTLTHADESECSPDSLTGGTRWKHTAMNACAYSGSRVGTYTYKGKRKNKRKQIGVNRGRA
ncbi:unnamed protein product, partial [Ectocarpus sp. 8 AP-2014]